MKKIIVYGRKIDSSGGVENYIYNLYSNLDRKKYYLILIIPDLESKESVDNKKFYSVFDEVLFIDSHTNNLVKHVKQQYSIYKQHRNSIIHIHASNGFHSINGLIAKLAGVRSIIFHSHNSSGIESLSIKISRLIYRFSGDEFLGCTRAAVEYLFGKNIIEGTNYKIAKNAINSAHYSFSEKKREEIRKDFSIESDTLLLGFVGRLSSEKNIIFLIELLDEMIKNKYKCKLLIVGDGPEKEKICYEVHRKELNEYVIMSGSRDDISNIMSGLDLFLLPSEYEALGIVLIEAQTSGLQCLASTNVSRDSKISNKIAYLEVDKNVWLNKIRTLDFDYDRSDYDIFTKRCGYDLSDSILMIEDLYDEL